MINPRQEAIKLAYDKLYKKQMGDKNFEVAWTPSCKYNNSSREVETFKFLYMKVPELGARLGYPRRQKNFTPLDLVSTVWILRSFTGCLIFGLVFILDDFCATSCVIVLSYVSAACLLQCSCTGPIIIRHLIFSVSHCSRFLQFTLTHALSSFTAASSSSTPTSTRTVHPHLSLPWRVAPSGEGAPEWPRWGDLLTARWASTPSPAPCSHGSLLELGRGRRRSAYAGASPPSPTTEAAAGGARG